MVMFDRQDISELLLELKYILARFESTEKAEYQTSKFEENNPLSSGDRLGSNSEKWNLTPEESATIEETIDVLPGYSLVVADRYRRTFQIHRLVQLATIGHLAACNTLQMYKDQALRILARACPNPTHYSAMNIFRVLEPHLENVLSNTYDTRRSRLIRAEVLHARVIYLETYGMHERAEVLATFALNELTELRGPEHTDTFWAAISLGWLYATRNKYNKAKAHVLKYTHTADRVLGVRVFPWTSIGFGAPYFQVNAISGKPPANRPDY